MTPFVGILLVVAASFLWSGLDLLRKVLVEKIAPVPLLFFLTAGMAPLYAVWSVIEGNFTLPPEYWAPALASVGLNLVANLAFFESVRISPLSLTIPLLSFTPVFATLLAAVFLGEIPSTVQVVGVLVVVAGALLLNLRAGETSLAKLARAFVREKGAPLMLLVALLWAATISFDKLAMAAASPPLHALVLSGGIGLIALVILMVRGRLGELRAAAEVPLPLIASLVVGATALGLQLVALQAVLVSLVETLKRGIGNALAVLWGRIFFSEAVTGGKVAGVLLMAVGVALVVMG